MTHSRIFTIEWLDDVSAEQASACEAIGPCPDCQEYTVNNLDIAADEAALAATFAVLKAHEATFSNAEVLRAVKKVIGDAELQCPDCCNLRNVD